MNTEKLEKLKKSLDNKFIPDNMKDKIRAEIKKLEADIKTDETITATEVKEEVKEIEKKVEKALEVAEEKEEQAEAKAEEKKEKAPRKAREKKATQSETKTPKVEPKSIAKKKSVFSIAKEIRKDNESWEDAKERARKMMKSETTETKKKTRTETDKLLAMVRRNKEYKKLAGTSNLPKDASRRALPRGKRVSQGGWKNQYGESEGGKVYYENRANRVDVGGFKNAYLENGGEIEMENSNLYFVGRGRDVNGNKVIKISFPNQKPFSIQTLGNLPKTHRILREYDNDKDITPEEIATIEREIISYVEEFGSKKQKESLRKYEGGGYADKGVYVETLDEEIDLTDDGIVKATKTQQGGNKSFGERREMHGASPEALAFDNGGSVEDEKFKKFINSQVSYIISLKTISQKREPIKNILDNMEDYRSGSEIVKRITTDNLKYALQQKTVSKMNEVLRISLNALQYAEGGTIIGTPETPLARGLDIDYTGLVGETGGMSAGEMFAEGGSLGNHGLKQGDEIIKTMSGGVQKVKTKSGDIVYVNLANGYRGDTPPLPFAKGGYTNERRHVNKAQDYEVRYAKQRPNRTGYSGKRSFDDGGFMTDPNFGDFQNGVYAGGGGIEKSNPFVEIVKIMKDADLSMNNEDERKILDLSINMALQNGGRYMCPFNKSMFNLTPKQIDYIDALIQNYVTKYGKKPNFGMKVNGKYFPIQLQVYSKFIQGSNRYENKKYLLLYSELDANYSHGGEVSFIDYKYSEIMYEPNYKKYYANDVEFDSLQEAKDFLDSGEIDPSIRDAYKRGLFATGGVTKNYINRNQLNTITIKKGNQKLTYKVSDVYNGAYKLEDGGNLERTAFYVSKRNVVKVQLKDGKDIKVANGYWIKKGAKPIHTSKYDDGGEVEYKGGGKTTFKEKATAIAKNFEGKKVEPKYQKEYGKTYDKAEAKEVGNKIAGSQKAKYDSKMSGGGSTKRGGAMQLAKQIRKDGESWQSALKRANEQMRNK